MSDFDPSASKDEPGQPAAQPQSNVPSPSSNPVQACSSQGAAIAGPLSGIPDRTPEELEALERDPAHGGEITEGSRQEAKVGLELEKAGKVRAPITRDPTGAAEFIDGADQKWDVKGFNSDPRFPPKKGGFSLTRDAGKVDKSLANNENVMLDTSKMTPKDVAALKAEGDKRGWGDKVQWYGEGRTYDG